MTGSRPGTPPRREWPPATRRTPGGGTRVDDYEERRRATIATSRPSRPRPSTRFDRAGQPCAGRPVHQGPEAGARTSPSRLRGTRSEHRTIRTPTRWTTRGAGPRGRRIRGGGSAFMRARLGP